MAVKARRRPLTHTSAVAGIKGWLMNSIFRAARTLPAQEEILPRIELIEYDASYTVKADIHGAEADGVSLSLEGGVLTITSEDRSGFADGVCVLPRLNSFRYTLALPDDVDETALSIECEGRILTLTFGRRK
jgi:HSP20 family molecular chaperone IbpA